MRIIHKAPKGDYPEYAEMYMKLSPDDGRILEHLETNFKKVKSFIQALPEEKLLHRYQPGKWTIKELLVHIIDDRTHLCLPRTPVCPQRAAQPDRF